jgi:trimeric autotransporter adhesin
MFRPHKTRVFSILLLNVVVGWATGFARAQEPCGAGWLPGGPGVQGMDGDVTTLTTLINGYLVAGGFFGTAGGVPANHLARWNGSSWSALGAGMTGGTYGGYVFALTTLPNGDLVAGGDFTTAGGVPVNYIARWDGGSWSALGSGMNNDVADLITLPNGNLIACGAFTNAGGVSANRIALWNGSLWSALGAGMNYEVWALAALPNGDLIAGGEFTNAGGVPVNSIARWDGSSWSAMGSGMTGGTYGDVLCLTTLPNGDLVAGGDFTAAGGVPANYIARWDGSSWSALGSGIAGRVPPLEITVVDLTTLPNGDLVVGGSFLRAGGVTVNSIARWNGSAWSALGSGLTGANSVVYALTMLPNGDLVAAGEFTTAGGVPANNIARYSFGDISCYANCDCSSSTPVLNATDFLCYLQKFAAADPYANCDGSTTQPILNVTDFTCFLQKFAQGCP